MAVFMMASALAGVIGNPISGAVMQFLDGVAGLKGWQWIFLAEGLPSVLLGIVVLFYLADGPAHARWLAPAERDWLLDRLEADDPSRRQQHGATLRQALTDRRVWMLIGVYFTVAVGSNASGAHFPKVIGQRFGHQPELATAAVGLLGSPDSMGPMLASSAHVCGSVKNEFAYRIACSTAECLRRAGDDLIRHQLRSHRQTPYACRPCSPPRRRRVGVGLHVSLALADAGRSMHGPGRHDEHAADVLAHPDHFSHRGGCCRGNRPHQLRRQHRRLVWAQHL